MLNSFFILFQSNDGGQELANKDATTTNTAQVSKDSGLPQAIASDFGVSFGNPMYDDEDL